MAGLASLGTPKYLVVYWSTEVVLWKRASKKIYDCQKAHTSVSPYLSLNPSPCLSTTLSYSSPIWLSMLTLSANTIVHATTATGDLATLPHSPTYRTSFVLVLVVRMATPVAEARFARRSTVVGRDRGQEFQPILNPVLLTFRIIAGVRWYFQAESLQGLKRHG